MPPNSKVSDANIKTLVDVYSIAQVSRILLMKKAGALMRRLFYFSIAEKYSGR